MSSSFDQLQPASQHQTAVYLPYIQGNKRNLLPYAISLYQKGVLEGQRKIEASDNIPFVASWNVATLPSDLTRCRMQFDANSELTYEVMMASYEFITFLIELMENYKRHRITDFSKPFYRKLLCADDDKRFTIDG
ncbi:MAG: type IV pilus biogenesis protein EbsA [Cuspidothrix sp.]